MSDKDLQKETEEVKKHINDSKEELDAWWENKFKDNYIKPLHDEIKEHPFWRTLSNDFHYDCSQKLRELLNKFIGHFTRDELVKSPHAILIQPIMHNMFDCILKSQIMPKYHDGHTIMETKAFGNYIMAMQTALQIVHYYIDGIFDEETMVSYEPTFKYDKDTGLYTDCTYKTYGARSNGDGTYRSVRIIVKDEILTEIKRNEEMRDGRKNTADYFRTHGNKPYAESIDKEVEYHQSCINDLKDNKGKHYIIK